MSRKLFWCVIFILPRASEQKLKLQEAENRESTTADCISELVATLGQLKSTFWYPVDKSDLVVEILKKVEIPVVLNVVEEPKKRGMETRISSEVIVLLDDFKAENVLNGTLWNGQTQFILVGKRIEDVKTAFEQFWEHKVINVFGIVEEEDDISVYSFLPYEKGGCGVGEPLVVDKYLATEGSFVNNGKLFKDPARIKNLNGCRVNITIVNVKPNVMFQDECGCKSSTHVHGIEGNLMNEVAKVFNFNATYVIAMDGIGWGWIRPSPHGAVGEVYTGRSDFAIGLLAPTVERFETLDISLPYNGEECITYGVPTGAGASTPNWIKILVFEFTPVTWIFILISFILIFEVFRWTNKYSSEVWLQSKVDIILYIFSSCLGLPVKVPQYLSMKLSLISWITFSFITTVAYKSSMGSKLTVPNRDPDINTFKELLNSNLELTGYNNMLRLLQYNGSEPYVKEMEKKFKVTNYDIDYAVDRIAAERKIAYVRHTTTFLYYALINPKAKGHIHLIKDCILLYYPMVVTKKHSPFSYRLNQLVSRLSESGITKRWRSEYIYEVPPPQKPFLKLSNDHMYGVFCILGFGCTIGLITFVIEIVGFYVTKKNVTVLPKELMRR